MLGIQATIETDKSSRSILNGTDGNVFEKSKKWFVEWKEWDLQIKWLILMNHYWILVLMRQYVQDYLIKYGIK